MSRYKVFACPQPFNVKDLNANSFIETYKLVPIGPIFNRSDFYFDRYSTGHKTWIKTVDQRAFASEKLTSLFLRKLERKRLPILLTEERQIIETLRKGDLCNEELWSIYYKDSTVRHQLRNKYTFKKRFRQTLYFFFLCLRISIFTRPGTMRVPVLIQGPNLAGLI